MSGFNFDEDNTSIEFYREYIRDNIAELCEHSFPKGKKIGTSWYLGSIAGDEGNSLEIALEPREKAGLWLDRATEEKGDFIDLIQQNFKEVNGRELSFADTLKQIFEAGPPLQGTTPHGKTQNQNKLKAYSWWAHTFTLKKDARTKEKLARERGYSLTTIEKIVEAELIGVHGASWEWVFPIHHDGIVVGIHKKSGDQWFVEPKGMGIGVPPLIYGSLAEAEEINISESQWDIFSLADLRGVDPAQQRIAFAATRGAQNSKAIEEILSQLGENQRIYLWPQRDLPDPKTGKRAGEGWLDKVFGIASGLGLSVIPCWIPDLHPERKFDLNDWLREGATREQAEEIIKRAETVGPRGKHLVEESVRRTERYLTEYEKIPGGMREEAFYGLAGEITRICVTNSECSPEAVLVQFLVLFGNLIGRYAYASGGSKKLFTNEYGVILGPTASARKGTALMDARLPLKLIEPHWSKFCVKGGLTSGEGLIHHIRDPRMNNRGTAVADHGIEDKRFQSIEEEFAEVVIKSVRNGNTLTTVLRKAWDSPDNLDIPTRTNPARASYPHVSFIGHITREELLELDLKNITGGLINRFLWAYAKKVRDFPDAEEIDWEKDHPEILGKLKEAVRRARIPSRILVTPGDPSEQEPETLKIELSPEARAYWHTIYCRLNEEKKRNTALDAILMRDTSHIRKVALWYTLLDSKSTTEIVHLDAALAVIDHSQECALYAFSGTSTNKLANRILPALRRASSEGMTRKEIVDDVCQRHYTKSDLDEALVHLIKNNFAHVEVWQSSQKGGKNTERWFANTKRLTEGRRDRLSGFWRSNLPFLRSNPPFFATQPPFFATQLPTTHVGLEHLVYSQIGGGLDRKRGGLDRGKPDSETKLSEENEDPGVFRCLLVKRPPTQAASSLIPPSPTEGKQVRSQNSTPHIPLKNFGRPKLLMDLIIIIIIIKRTFAREKKKIGV